MAVLLFLDLFGIIKFTYPKIVKIENTLNNPIKVSKINGNQIILEDGRIIETQLNNEKLNYWIKKSDFFIELKDVGKPIGICFDLYSNNPRGLCGNQWGGMIMLKIIPIPITMKAHRHRFAFGEILINRKSQQKDALKSDSAIAESE